MQILSPAHPGEVIKEDVIGAYGLSVTDAARVLGVGRPALSAVLNGRASLKTRRFSGGSRLANINDFSVPSKFSAIHGGEF